MDERAVLEEQKKKRTKLVSIAPCGDYDSATVEQAVHNALAPLGGIERFVSAGQRVLLKPNMLSAKNPDRAITTHPAIVEAVAREVKSAGGIPFIGDSPGGAIRGIKRVWENTGIKDVAERTGVELVNFEASGVREVTFGRYTFYIAKPVLEADVIINLPKLKTHSLTLLTCTMKNMFGTIPGFRKAEMHKLYPKPRQFAEMLVHLYKLVMPSVSIVDAVVAMDGNGPSAGRPYKIGVIMAGDNGVALDTVAAQMIGFEPAKIDTIDIAEAMGLGESRLEMIDIAGVIPQLGGDGRRPFELPSNRLLHFIPGFLIDIVNPFVWAKPVIDPRLCTGCGFCAENCPAKTIKKTGKVYRIDDSKCLNCMCCHELCPEHAIDIEMSWLAKRLT